jgi:hypothetical protein
MEVELGSALSALDHSWHPRFCQAVTKDFLVAHQPPPLLSTLLYTLRHSHAVHI